MHLMLVHQGILGTEFFLSMETMNCADSDHIAETGNAWGSRYSYNHLPHLFLFFQMTKAAQFHMPVLKYWVEEKGKHVTP